MKRIIAALTALMLLMPSALAETWITVSSWAYNDVSNFKKAGMLPESFDDISDFTQPVTRLQTAQILYSALSNVADNKFISNNYFNIFCDTDDESVLHLAARGIMTGEFSEERDENGLRCYFFYPDRLITREEMATILDRSFANFLSSNISYNYCAEPADYSEISDWAKESVINMMSIGIISGIGNNLFAPKDTLTIEQAISLVYRLYSYLPTGQEADGARLDGKTEETVQTYSNGIEETKKGNMLYLKQNGQILTEFETDIYSNIYCATVNGKILAAAQNRYGKTDIYDVSEKEISVKLPYPVYSVDSEYITVKSSVIGPFSFGLYDWNGNKVTDINYSLEELQQLKSNGFSSLTAQYNSPSGMIYFSDWNDGGSLCSIDSNGENKRKLSDKNCISRIYYLNDRLYYIAEENGIYSLYSVKTDGTGEVKITEYSQKTDSFSLLSRYIMYDGIANNGTRDGMLYSTKYDSKYTMNEQSYTQLATDGEWIYYLDNKGTYNSIYRFKINYDNTVEKEQISEDILSTGTFVQFKDGKIYFLDEKKIIENEQNGSFTDLYCFDGNILKKINGDLPVVYFGFCDEKLVIFSGTSFAEFTPYILNLDGSNPQIMENIKAAQDEYKQNFYDKQKALKNGEDYIDDSSHKYILNEYSNDKYTIYTVYDNSNKNNSSTYVRDFNENEALVFNGYHPILTLNNDNIIYIESDINTKSSYLIIYNISTQEHRVVARNYYDYLQTVKDNYIIYYDRNLNIWRYDIENDITEEIAPNSGTYKYGAVYDMFGKNDGMYKLDTDGNYCLVTNKEYAANCLYVENGTGKAIHF